jgi:hypothetical protein
MDSRTTCLLFTHFDDDDVDLAIVSDMHALPDPSGL